MNLSYGQREYVGLCVAQYMIEARKAEIEGDNTATAISCRLRNCINAAAIDISRLAKSEEDCSEMWNKFMNAIQKTKNVRHEEEKLLSQARVIDRTDAERIISILMREEGKL